MPFEEVARVLMQLSAGAFAGACIYILFVQHPVRLARPTRAALDDFRAAIPRAEKIQAPLLILCLVAIAAHLVLAFSWLVLIGGVLMTAVLVQTIATVLPINRRLLSGDAADHVPEADAALSRWGALHAVRTVMSVAGAVLLLFP